MFLIHFIFFDLENIILNKMITSAACLKKNIRNSIKFSNFFDISNILLL